MDGGTRFDAPGLLERIERATRELLRTARGFGDADVRAASLLPGWSRGHVLTHVARNADGGRRLLTWARTGVETPEYASLEAREAEIAAGAGRPAAALAADVADSARRFAAEYRRLGGEDWARVVRWTRGQEHPAARAADARWTEVLVHHVDLAAGYTHHRWPEDFAASMLERTVASLRRRPHPPAMRLRAGGGAASYEIGGTGGADGPLVEGSLRDLLAWLMGRTKGEGLTVRGGALPEPPALF
ncbi:maleylpyruvate isomerase family mycothiol-dependent enzyme [Streptomyces sp. HPF1205]|uniref:maleylpyruvate isomerase family mycothiol-dependent enzyme n=1 Tax=Streptomyces sp. HPF1205 TaxID=2873262 RepID=UPI001CEC1DA3|nr:maleylpyruvate isomerase family mycothiol-dependent enzyme [Streptomyces sp. HPF1205]